MSAARAATGAALAEAARGLVGCRFRLHGRDPATGLDCVGVVAAALAGCGRRAAVPGDYALRMRDVARVWTEAKRLGLRQATGGVDPGDVLLFHVGPAQHHLGIVVAGRSLVHAHAGLKRVVVAPPDPAWQQVGHWCLPADFAHQDI